MILMTIQMCLHATLTNNYCHGHASNALTTNQICLGKIEYQVWNLLTLILPPGAQMEDWIKGKKDERIINVQQMEQQLRLVVMRDATAMLGEEEYVSNMVQKQRNVFVVMRDVPTMSRKEEFVSGTVQRW